MGNYIKAMEHFFQGIRIQLRNLNTFIITTSGLTSVNHILFRIPKFSRRWNKTNCFTRPNSENFSAMDFLISQHVNRLTSNQLENNIFSFSLLRVKWKKISLVKKNLSCKMQSKFCSPGEKKVCTMKKKSLKVSSMKRD